jgi:hypothetical protein
VITVRMVTLIARIYQSASKGIDFVLTFLHADLDVDTYLFQIDHTKEE